MSLDSLYMLPLDVQLGDGKTKMSLRQQLSELSLSAKKILLQSMRFLSYSCKQIEEGEQPRWIQEAFVFAHKHISKGIQYFASLDCEKLGTTRYLREMWNQWAFGQIYKLGQ